MEMPIEIPHRLEGNINICINSILAFQICNPTCTDESYVSLTFSVTFWLHDVLLSFTVSRICGTYAYCLCQNHVAELQNWSSSKANKNTQEIQVCFIGWSPRYIVTISSAACRKIDTAEAATKLRNSLRCKSFNYTFVSISA